MDSEYTAIVKQLGDWWIGWVEEVPGVNCQERTRFLGGKKRIGSLFGIGASAVS